MPNAPRTFFHVPNLTLNAVRTRWNAVDRGQIAKLNFSGLLVRQRVVNRPATPARGVSTDPFRGPVRHPFDTRSDPFDRFFLGSLLRSAARQVGQPHG
jgi:hypothetical protein